MVLLISYDLNGRERPAAYERVKDVIETNALAWIRPLYSQWLIETNASPGAWTTSLRGVMDANDKLLIVQVTNRSYSGYLDTAVWEWLEQRGLSPAS
ncbi:MAG: hypothetical protein JW940_13735 [Polyangiaceae bacterium]|nr:hypothetical protein [Polyangiaceae bacterium]